VVLCCAVLAHNDYAVATSRAIQRGPRPVSARFLAKLFTAFGASIEVQARYIGEALEPWVRASLQTRPAALTDWPTGFGH